MGCICESEGRHEDILNLVYICDSKGSHEDDTWQSYRVGAFKTAEGTSRSWSNEPFRTTGVRVVSFILGEACMH